MTRFEKMCVGLGCSDAKTVGVDKIVFDMGLRNYCEKNACGCYGTSYSCPPFCGTAAHCISKAKKYSTALVFQTVTALEDSFDIEGMERAMKEFRTLSVRIYKQITSECKNALLLSAGCCGLCPQGCCAASGEPCRHPEAAAASVEAYCIDVSALCETTGMKYINGKDTVTYFGIILY